MNLWDKYKLHRKLQKARFVYFGDIKFDLENGSFYECKLDKAQGFEFIVEYGDEIRYFTEVWAEVFFINQNNITRHQYYLGKYYNENIAIDKYNFFCDFLKTKHAKALAQYQSLKHNYDI